MKICKNQTGYLFGFCIFSANNFEIIKSISYFIHLNRLRYIVVLNTAAKTKEFNFTLNICQQSNSLYLDFIITQSPYMILINPEMPITTYVSFLIKYPSNLLIILFASIPPIKIQAIPTAI